MSTQRLRAGRYVRQTGGYTAFVPTPLPPDPPLIIDRPLQRLLSDADIALGRLDGSVLTLPDPEQFVYMSVRKEAVLSSQIEGTVSSLQDLLASEAGVNVSFPSDVEEVINYLAAMRHGLKRLDTLPLSVRLIRELHAILLRGPHSSHLTPGEIRTSQNWIGRTGSSLLTATFVPPPRGGLAEALSHLERFIHGQDDLPYLIRVAMVHAHFEMIHPFLDGNGRVGRLLITLQLCASGVLAKPVLFLSWFFRNNQNDYYRLLQAVRDDGAWEDWVAFFLRGMTETSTRAIGLARAVLNLRDTHLHLIANDSGANAGNGFVLLEKMFRQPIVSIEDVQSICSVSEVTAHRLVQRLVAAGILNEITGYARNRRFRYDAYVNLFAD